MKTVLARSCCEESSVLTPRATDAMEDPTMRYSIVTGHWQLYRRSDSTAGKPRGYTAKTVMRGLTHELEEEGGPFALSARDDTPPEQLCYSVAAAERTASDEWCEDSASASDESKALVRAFDNKFPMLGHAESAAQPIEAALMRGVHPQLSGIGRCEVVVLHWRLNWCTAIGTAAEAAAGWKAINRRYRSIAEDPRNACVLVFENHGIKSGGSLPHAHAQLWGLPLIPREQRILYDVAIAYSRDNGGASVFERCLQDVLVPRADSSGAAAGGSRIVHQNAACVAFLPFAAERYNEIWVMPRVPGACFGDASAATLAGVADAARACLRAIYVAHNDPTYNIIVRTAPPSRATNSPALKALCASLVGTYRWYIQILPSTSNWSGVSLGFIVGGRDGQPEEKAAALRALADAPLPTSDGADVDAVVDEK